MSNVTKSSKIDGAINSRMKHVAESVKKRWCAYFDPDKKSFGKPSRCINCCCQEDGKYNAEMLDTECKRHHIIERCLPSNEEAEQYVV